MNEGLKELFAYDLWANRQWAFVADDFSRVALDSPSDAPPFGDPDRLADTFLHIVGGQRLWLARVGRPVHAEGSAWLNALHDAWIEWLSIHPADARFTYEVPGIGTRTRTVETIARHMFVHGAYHRGELRALAEHRGLSWPETDYTVWRLELGQD